MPPRSTDSLDAMLVLFARVPRAGEVKTRLAASIGEEAALAMHRAFLMDSLELLHRASHEGIARSVWFSEAWTPDTEIAALAAGIEIGAQVEGDLGERMSSCLAELLSGRFRRVAIIGTDTPGLPVETIAQAFRALADRDIVLGPSTDGGYYLLGARTVIPEMFRGIEWGGPRVYADTLNLLKMLGVGPLSLPEHYDVDTVEDLKRLAGEIEARKRAGEPFPRWSAAALDRLGHRFTDGRS